MTAKNSRSGPAPSTRAASYRLCGIFCTPAMKSTSARPDITHVPTKPTAGSAQVKSPSHGRASEPSPTARSARFSDPSAARRSSARSPRRRPSGSPAAGRAPSGSTAWPRIRARESAPTSTSPRRDRDDRVEDDQNERVHEGAAQQLGVCDDLAVVVEPDPGRRRQPVPLVQREPDRVPERGEHERGVDAERRQQIEVGDPPRLARRIARSDRGCRGASRPRQPGGVRSRLAGSAAQPLWNFE